MKLQRVLADTALKLSEAGVESAARDARILTAHALKVPISDLSLKVNENVTANIVLNLEK